MFGWQCSASKPSAEQKGQAESTDSDTADGHAQVTTDSKIRKECSRFGSIQKVTFPRPNQALVTFSTMRCAAAPASSCPVPGATARIAATPQHIPQYGLGSMADGQRSSRMVQTADP